MILARLDAAQAEGAIEERAEWLLDVVAGGASVNFVWPFGLDEARAFFVHKVFYKRLAQ